ncbi:MAG: SGNH/GDSL hydrolase family protein, partial [Actinobacteria bacterium]|nr:SGNH/GDSL hydrolase family protein [Actinomycetota bacterium]
MKILVPVFVGSLLAATSAVAVGTPPSTAPKISLVTRGANFLRIDFTNGRALGAKTYQYSLDAGATWFNGQAKGDVVTVNPVPLSRRTQVSLRGVNANGFGPASTVYGDTRAIFLGASITLGDGVSGKSWAKKAASILGWQYSNLASSGSGYMHPGKNGANCKTIRNFATQAWCGTSFMPDIVIISGGSNDCEDASHKQSRLKLQTQIQSTLAYTKSLFPGAQIIATPIISPAVNPCLKQISNWIASASASAGINFVTPADTWIARQKSEYSIDGVHPNLN